MVADGPVPVGPMMTRSERMRMATTTAVSVGDLEVFADRLDVAKAAAVYQEHGALVVRGLMKPYLAELQRDIEAAAAHAIGLLDRAERIVEGWRTPDGTLFLPAPPGYPRDKQIMVLSINYMTSAAFFRSAFDPTTVEIVSAIV